MEINYKCVDKLLPIWKNNTTWNCIYGGRGGTKTFFGSEWVIFQAMLHKKANILVGREVQKSLKDSSYETIMDRLEHFQIEHLFKTIHNEMIYLPTQSKLIFRGLHINPQSIKSIKNLKAIWLDEASTISINSMRQIIPTMSRNPGCKFLATFNPENVDDPAYQMFAATDKQRDPDFPYDYRDVATIIFQNYDENPYISRETHPEFFAEIDRMRERDPEEFAHVYLGGLFYKSDRLVFKKSHWQKVKSLDPPKEAQTVIGMDFGGGGDSPSTIIETKYWETKHLNGQGQEYTEKHFYISDEISGAEWSVDEHISKLKQMPSTAHSQIIGDSASPDLIYAIKTAGFNIRGANKSKNKNSIREGVRFMKDCNIYINEQCPKTIEEFERWCYKVNERTERVLDDFEDVYDHHIDGARYAIEEQRLRASQIHYSGGFISKAKSGTMQMEGVI